MLRAYEQGCQCLENREKSRKFGGQGKVRKFCQKSGNFIKNLIFLVNDATKPATYWLHNANVFIN